MTDTADTANPLALESQVCFALAVASRSVIAAYRPVLEPVGLTHPQYLVMLALWENEPLSVRRLADLLALEPATVSPLLKRLEALGYVARRRSDSDERVVEITLTDTGRELRSYAETIPATMMERLGMTPDDLRNLHRTMSALIRATRDL
ncbi:MarR family transcriptional regulator [Leifsonia sp. Leaf336]|uniref:MarR family winged helix-turn-helix transcriptional regulator n=1 Tax=Leifsonia sp. Leaf336 TaxID=1736341 RepID=UPI0006F2E32F|nr:MarR family transcriptional regulator [Leifsonia sp. Leaf336]KQR52642.1 MarR family transcriptional regulator [Leifsonia sp. Leaf336]